MDVKKAALFTAICGLVVFISVLLPWYSVSPKIPSGASAETAAAMASSGISLNGTQSPFSGTFTLILGIVAALAALPRVLDRTQGLPLSQKQLAAVSFGALAVATLVTLIDFFDHSPKGESTEYGSAGKGIGIWLALLASAAGVYCAWMFFSKTPGSLGKATGTPGSATPPAAPPAAPPPSA